MNRCEKGESLSPILAVVKAETPACTIMAYGIGEFLSDTHFLDLVSAHKSMHSYCACTLRQSFMGEP